MVGIVTLHCRDQDMDIVLFAVVGTRVGCVN